jgi:TolB-like protein/opacity protein-like surface antigen
MKRCSVVLITLFLLSVVVFPEDTGKKVAAAVVDFQAKEGISENLASTISDYFRTQLFNTNKFILVTRESMDLILKEQNFQVSGCTSQECVVQMGQMLGVSKVFTGTLGTVGSIYLLNIKMLNIETGEMEKAASEKVTGGKEGLLEAIEIIAAKMAGLKPTLQEKKVLRRPTPTPSIYKPIVPAQKPKQTGYQGYGFFDISFGLGFGSMQLQFIRSDPQMVPGELGLSGSLPASFSHINWPSAKVSIKYPLSLRVGGFLPAKRAQNKPGSGFLLNIFFLQANIKEQVTDNWQIDYEKVNGDFTFVSDDYFTTKIFGMDILYLMTIIYVDPLHIYCGGGIGFTLNSWEAPYIKGYTDSDTFSAPSSGTNIGIDIPITAGFRYTLMENFQLFIDYNFKLCGFKQNRNVKNENNLAGYFINIIKFGIGYSFF